jgi:hypothetical protein
VNRLARIEIGLALASLALAILASLYLVISMFGAHEVCYGISSRAILCNPLKPGTAEYAQVAGRLLFVILTLLVLYVGGALGAWWHQRAKEPSARSAALGLLCACAFFLLGVTIPAVSGAGFFLIPSTTLMAAAAVLGLVGLLLDTRTQARGVN